MKDREFIVRLPLKHRQRNIYMELPEMAPGNHLCVYLLYFIQVLSLPQVRHDRHNVGPHCRLKFATDGILLREIQDDFLLR